MLNFAKMRFFVRTVSQSTKVNSTKVNKTIVRWSELPLEGVVGLILRCSSIGRAADR